MKKIAQLQNKNPNFSNQTKTKFLVSKDLRQALNNILSPRNISRNFDYRYFNCRCNGRHILVAKTRIAAAQTLTVSSPIHGIKDSALWLETAVDTSFVKGETANNNSITTWYDARKSSYNKVTIIAAGTGPVYSNTIN